MKKIVLNGCRTLGVLAVVVLMSLSSCVKDDIRKTEEIRRTMVEIPSQGSSTVYILVAFGKTQTDANTILTTIFGCSDVVMFDGSASSQFKTINGNYSMTSSRDVPVFFAIK